MHTNIAPAWCYFGVHWRYPLLALVSNWCYSHALRSTSRLSSCCTIVKMACSKYSLEYSKKEWLVKDNDLVVCNKSCVMWLMNRGSTSPVSIGWETWVTICQRELASIKILNYHSFTSIPHKFYDLQNFCVCVFSHLCRSTSYMTLTGISQISTGLTCEIMFLLLKSSLAVAHSVTVTWFEFENWGGAIYWGNEDLIIIQMRAINLVQDWC